MNSSDIEAALQQLDRIPIVGRRPVPVAEYSEWSGGIFGARIQIGWDIRIEIFPNRPWTSAKIFFFEGLAAIVGADLTNFEAGLALSRLVEGINQDPEHDEGGWIAVHSRNAR